MRINRSKRSIDSAGNFVYFRAVVSEPFDQQSMDRFTQHHALAESRQCEQGKATLLRRPALQIVLQPPPTPACTDLPFGLCDRSKSPLQVWHTFERAIQRMELPRGLDLFRNFTQQCSGSVLLYVLPRKQTNHAAPPSFLLSPLLAFPLSFHAISGRQ